VISSRQLIFCVSLLSSCPPALPPALFTLFIRTLQSSVASSVKTMHTVERPGRWKDEKRERGKEKGCKYLDESRSKKERNSFPPSLPPSFLSSFPPSFLFSFPPSLVHSPFLPLTKTVSPRKRFSSSILAAERPMTLSYGRTTEGREGGMR